MTDGATPPSKPYWTRLLSRLAALAETLEMSGPDFQDRRIDALERRLAALECDEVKCRPVQARR